MKIYFSPTTLAFYPDEFKKEYQKSGSWPSDAILVEYGAFKKYSLEVPPMGFKLGVTNNSPCWVEDEDSVEESQEEERVWRDSELARSDIELYKVQDSDPKAKGIVPDWRNYRKALRAWPEHNDFPNKESRPIAPDV